MKKRLLCILLTLALMVSLPGCGLRSRRSSGDASKTKNKTVQLHRPPKRQRLFLPPKNQDKGESQPEPETQQNERTETNSTGTHSAQQSEKSSWQNAQTALSGRSYNKELKLYQESMSKLKGKSFVLTMDADIALEAREGGRRQSAKEQVNLTANVRKNDKKNMEMSGSCQASAPSASIAFTFYQKGSDVFVEYTSPRHISLWLDELPASSLMQYQHVIEKEDVLYGEELEDGVALLIDGSVLDLKALVKDLVSGFDSVSCDTIELQLYKDQKGRPSELVLFYTVEFALGDATATADYVETLTFTDYGKAKIQKPAALTEKIAPSEEETEKAVIPELNLDEMLEPQEESDESASKEGNETQEPGDKSDTGSSDGYQDAYEAILDEYRGACAASLEEYQENAETKYPHVNPYVMEDYHVSFHQSPGAENGETSDELYELYYACYDIDGNGIPELLIRQSLQDTCFCDLYAFDGGNAVKLFADLGEPGDLGGAVSARANEDGIIVKQYPGDADYYRLAEDGYSLESASGMIEEKDAVQPDWQVLAEDIDGGTVDGENNSAVAAAYREKLAELSAEDASYTLFDLTGDGVEELIVCVTDTIGDDWTYCFYSYYGGELQELGMLRGLSSILLRDENGGLIMYTYLKESVQIDRITYDGSQVVSARLGEIDFGAGEESLDEDPIEEWERENAAGPYQELQMYLAADTHLLDVFFGTGTEAEDSSDKPELSDYLWSIEEFHQLVGGEPSEEAGDYENWYILDGMQYGNYIDSSQVDEIELESTGYSLFGVAVGEDADLVCQRLEDDGWTVSDAFDDSCTLVKEGRNLSIYSGNGRITGISMWNTI